jgi:hypothetical protein
MTQTIGIIIRPFADIAVSCLTNKETLEHYYKGVDKTFIKEYKHGDFVAYATREKKDDDTNIAYHIFCTNDRCLEYADAANFNQLVRNLYNLINILSFGHKTPLYVNEAYNIVSSILYDIIIQHTLTHLFEKQLYCISNGETIMPWEWNK